MAESSNSTAPEPTPEEGPESKAQGDEEAGWTVVTTKKGKKKYGQAIGKSQSFLSTKYLILGHAYTSTELLGTRLARDLDVPGNYVQKEGFQARPSF